MATSRERRTSSGLPGRAARSRTVGPALLAAWLAPFVGTLDARGQAPSGEESPARFAIVDNSFFIEEAFNQEPGIFQNILGLLRSDEGTWELAFTQEWPAGTQRHQLSYTIPFAGGDGASGIGDIFVHYRLQALTETEERPAFAPRLSLILPTGDEDEGFGSGHMGAQTNLPFSKQVGDVYLHWSAGLTYARQDGESLWTPNLGASAIWRAGPMLNLMLETVAHFEERIVGPGATHREATWLLAPGVRGGWNLGDHQLIVGGAVAVGLTETSDDFSVFAYFSYELPFRR